MNKAHLELHRWMLKARDPNLSLEEDFAQTGNWLAAEVPGNVYQTLLEAGQIPDPFYGLNEPLVQWVAHSDWLYRTSFEMSPQTLLEPHIDLCLDGLDTFATVWLNGEQILQSDNMFVPHRVNIKPQLRQGPNELHILFESALRKGRELEQHYGKRHLWNGDSSRLYVRKAQYHYGWDWGPVLLTAGPWKAVYLEAYTVRIAEIHAPPVLSADLTQASLPIAVQLEGMTQGAEMQIALYDPDGTPIHHSTHPASSLQHHISIDAPQLWWPNGYGPQALYTLQVSLHSGGQRLTEQTQRLGLRQLRVVQEPVEGEAGSSFYFEVNHTPIFAGGANWIPDDTFLNRITPQRYAQRVRQAAQAHLVMLRVWGGGIYEDSAFYEACDELGLLVWQDFMFACGLYPAHREFLHSVQLEAQATVRRLRHHPSLALWCGNNEDYAIAESVGWYGPGADRSRFVALEIYEQLLPEICKALDPTRLYWPGSPYGGALSSEPTIGDRHTWEIWHGNMAAYQQYPQFEGRLVSEFGMQSFPSLALLERYIPQAERFPQSRTLEHHNKAGPTGGRTDGHRRLAVYLSDNLKDPLGLEGYVYSTQFIQAEAMRYAYSGFRRRWGRAGRRAVGGALVWQLNDCWPVTSWAIIDSLGSEKPAYYVIRRAMAPITVGLSPEGAVWAVNGTAETRALALNLQGFALDGQEVANETRLVHLEPNRTTELGSWKPPADEPLILSARLLEGNTVIARDSQWPEPYKFYRFPEPELQLEAIGQDSFSLSVKKPAKGVCLEAPGARWSDNFLDLLPGDPQIVQVGGLTGKTITVRWLEGQPLKFGL